MKKKKVLICVILTVAISSGFYIYQNYSKNTLQEDTPYSEIYKYVSSVTSDTLQEKIRNNDEFILYIGRASCGDCLKFESNLVDIIEKYNLSNKLYYFNTYWLYKEKNEEYQQFKKEYNYSQTPCFIYYKDGQEVDKIEWTDKGLTKSQLIEWLENNNLVEE